MTDLDGSADLEDLQKAEPVADSVAESVAASTTSLETAGAEAPPAIDVDAERRMLVDLLIYAWDRARSPGVWERLTLGLEPLGITVIRPDGEIFDPTRHEVGGVSLTEDESLHGRIAETETVGFEDRGRLIRDPIVVVYRSR